MKVTKSKLNFKNYAPDFVSYGCPICDSIGIIHIEDIKEEFETSCCHKKIKIVSESMFYFWGRWQYRSVDDLSIANYSRYTRKVLEQGK